MKIKVSKASGIVLDWLVAKCRGYKEVKIYLPSRPNDKGWIEVRINPEPKAALTRFDPTINWEYGGPIIEREKINIEYPRENLWTSNIWLGEPNKFAQAFGDTPLIAAMRCFVTSKLGKEVDVPDELL